MVTASTIPGTGTGSGRAVSLALGTGAGRAAMSLLVSDVGTGSTWAASLVLGARSGNCYLADSVTVATARNSSSPVHSEGQVCWRYPHCLSLRRPKNGRQADACDSLFSQRCFLYATVSCLRGDSVTGITLRYITETYAAIAIRKDKRAVLKGLPYVCDPGKGVSAYYIIPTGGQRQTSERASCECESVDDTLANSLVLMRVTQGEYLVISSKLTLMQKSNPNALKTAISRLPVRSQGDSQSDNKVMDNVTVRQGETVFLRLTAEMAELTEATEPNMAALEMLANANQLIPYFNISAVVSTFSTSVSGFQRTVTGNYPPEDPTSGLFQVSEVQVSSCCSWLKEAVRTGSRIWKAGTQLHSSGPYLSQSMRYCSFLPLCRESIRACALMKGGIGLLQYRSTGEYDFKILKGGILYRRPLQLPVEQEVVMGYGEMEGVILGLRLLFAAKFHSLKKKKKKDNYGALLPGLHPTPLCSCSQGDVVTHTAWLNRSSILYAGVDKWSVDPRVSLVTFNRDEFTIKIENVDVSDEGLYVCAVQTSSRPRTTFVHIIVQVANVKEHSKVTTGAGITFPGTFQFNIVPPKIIDFSKDMVVNEGTNVTLMCLANGKPEPAINWRVHSLSGERQHASVLHLMRPHLSPFVTVQESGGSVGSDDEYLDIPSISRHKAGEYECMAANDIAADTRTLRLVVNYPPSVLGGRDIGVTLGQRGVLQCEADAVPAAAFEWYRDDRRIFNGFDGIEINDSGTFSKLTLFNVSETDYGNYTCVAINKLGSANTSIVLY
ncbi:hypothetical protein P4O66_005678, partial [Electrophorus voltai]